MRQALWISDWASQFLPLRWAGTLSAAMAIALSSLGTITGCADFGGGADVVPEVTFVPADSAESTAEADGGDASDVAAVPTGTAGGFAGKVILTGAAPALSPLIRQGSEVKDKEVCAATDLADERLMLGDGNGVANVFVFLSRAPKGGKPLEISTDPILFDQKNCRFLPHCVIAPVGQEVRVLSDDPIAHNTHTYPKKQTGISQIVNPMDRAGDAVRFAYKKSEGVPFPVTCDFHGWMLAYHLVLDHPYAALTDAAGAFSIPDLPPGKHDFMVWHEAADGGFVERKLSVDVKASETTEMQIDYPVAKLKL